MLQHPAPPSPDGVDLPVTPAVRIRGNLDLTRWDSLADAPEDLRLVGEPRPADAPATSGVVAAPVAAEVRRTARALAVARSGRPAGSGDLAERAVLLAAFVATLHRYSGAERFLVGLPDGDRAGRVPDVVGPSDPTLAVRAVVSPEQAFTDLLDRTAATLADALAHRQLPRAEVAEAVGRPGVVRAAFVLRAAPDGAAAPDAHPARPADASAPSADPAHPADPGGPDVEEVTVHRRVPGVDLALVVTPADDGFRCELEYADGALTAAAAERFLAAYRTLLADAVHRPATRIDELLLLPAGRHAALAARVNSGYAVYPDLEPIHEPFEAAAARWPEAVAVECGGTTIRYRELDRRANALAHRLAGAGIGPEHTVGVLVDRSVDLAVAVLATLKAGAAFVPLDARAPAQRLATVATDAGLRTVLTQPHLLDRLAAVPVPTTVVPSDGEAERPPPVPRSLDRAAYVYYTSGSTGTPKGVVLDHRCAAGRLEWLARRYRLAPGDRVVHKTPLIFDVAIWEIFGPLAAGATVAMADPGLEADVAHLAGLLTAERTVFGHFVPSMLGAYLDSAPERTYPDLRWVQLSGEAVGTRLLERFAGHFTAELHNLYGQTETSEVAGWEGRGHDGGDRVPLGRPLGIYRLLVLDRALRPVPVGVPGELCVAGVGGLARGYHGRPALTAERFVPHPYPVTPGERLYRTGDLAAVDEHGILHYLGRVDDQTKIRGCRVEVGEVEAVLGRHPGVADCAVVARPDDDGVNQLVAYVVGDVAVAELAAHAERLLPGYMLPAVYVALAALPLGHSGKLDRRALPAPTSADRTARVTGDDPRTAVETELSGLWQSVLGVERVGRTDDFFAIGGNSLRALQVLNRVNATFGVRVTVRQFFAEPTVRHMAATIQRSLTDLVAAMSEEDAAKLLDQMER
ncbi:amino acid adenylation domain-containing protein [Micromonospora sp. NPDC023956]|uniref:non-ribosomal peptide synthetase n=1 Tax=Micromonospora sp. NPDC023956 TaxID=3155722 RepID=UPI0033DA1F1D